MDMMNARFSFQWHITDRCFGRCAHCYQSSFDGADDLSVDALKNIFDCIDDVVSRGGISIDITGGEPLLRDDVFELMTYLSAQDGVNDLGIITSGMIVGEKIIDRMKSVKKLSRVKVSLESHAAEINDGIRGIGSFETVTRNIRLLTNAKLPVILMTTVNMRNYNHARGILELAIELGAQGVMFERYIPIGAHTTMRDDVLTSAAWDIFLNSLCGVTNLTASNVDDVGDVINDDAGSNDVGDDGTKILRAYNAFYIDVSNGSLGDDCSLNAAPCCLGDTSMALMPDGTVYPCRRVPVSIGKLPRDDFHEIQTRLREFSKRKQACLSSHKNFIPRPARHLLYCET